MKGKDWIRLRKAMEVAGMRGKDLARSLGVHYVTVSRWLHGATEPCIEELVAIARTLNVSVDYLVGMDL